jgi:hypothetical protein
MTEAPCLRAGLLLCYVVTEQGEWDLSEEEYRRHANAEGAAYVDAALTK